MPSGGLGSTRRLLGGFALVAAAAIAAAPISSASRLPSAKAAPQGSIKYFNVPSALHDPYWITVGPDGNLWFTDEAASLIGRITPKGKIKEFKIGKNKRPKGIVTGPDGNLWFTESTVDKIGVMSPEGERLHEYAVPTSGATPWGIAVGPDDNIWFTEQGTGEDVINDVGRVIVKGPEQGFVTEFELFPCPCQPIGVTTGPDGNLWASEELGVFNGFANGTIDRISPDGQTIDRFPVTENDFEQVLPGYVAPGPDGNVWFGQFNAERHMIGSIDPSGVVTDYEVPTTNATVNAITTGPDGNLWFTTTDFGDDQIFNMTTAGTFLDDFLTHSTPIGITTGPDGNIWFTSRGNGEIGRLITARPSRRYVINIASGFVPARRTVRLGTVVQWMFQAPLDHGVSDETGLDLFDSDILPPASQFTNRFTYAGTYNYEDPTTGDGGRIGVRPRVPRRGQRGEAFTVTWSTTNLTDSLVFDVQVKRPGATSWDDWRFGTGELNDDFTPREPGQFKFRIQLREASGGSGNGSLWSPVAVVRVRR